MTEILDWTPADVRVGAINAAARVPEAPLGTPDTAVEHIGEPGQLTSFGSALPAAEPSRLHGTGSLPRGHPRRRARELRPAPTVLGGLDVRWRRRAARLRMRRWVLGKL